MLALQKQQHLHFSGLRESSCAGSDLVTAPARAQHLVMPSRTALAGSTGAQLQRTLRYDSRQSPRTVCAAATPLALPGMKRIAIFVEPSPFSHVSGMKIRFSNLIKGLREIGDEVTVVTPCVDPPKTFCGAKVCQHLEHHTGQRSACLTSPVQALADLRTLAVPIKCYLQDKVT